MTPKKTIAGLSATAILMVGIDASALAETPLDRTEMVAEEIVQAKQVDNIVETSFSWKDQNGIKVKYDMGEPSLLEKFKDKRNKEVITETVDFGDGGFKVDILLNEKPDTNVFCYQIEGAENYDFFYQPPLTADEIFKGNERPENIVGSYAVYHKTLKDHRKGSENYATGKVMHIPRPQVWELDNEESTKEWADLSYSDKDGLCVTVRQEFLDKATYPVRVDPTFGYTSLGASGNTTSGHYRGTNFITIEDGIITKITMGYYSTVVNNFVTAAIFDGGKPSPLIAYTNQDNTDYGNLSCVSGMTMHDMLLNASSSNFLQKNTAYKITGNFENNTACLAYDSGSIETPFYTILASSYPPPSIVTFSTTGWGANQIYSIYATYTVPTPATTTYSCSGGICGGVNLSGGINLR